jgi:predicted RNA-binding protein with PIN domain
VGGERPIVVVDAENVRRSVWPNVPRRRLVELLRHWAETHGHDVLVVFDGEPEGDGGEHVQVVGSREESADDRIVRETAELGRYWLVTSDRELRDRAGDGAERVLGGGSFVRELIAS